MGAGDPLKRVARPPKKSYFSGQLVFYEIVHLSRPEFTMKFSVFTHSETVIDI